MGKKKKIVQFYQNPYYHCVVAIMQIKIPSKRPEIKFDENGNIISGKISKGYLKFNELIKKELLKRKNSSPPYKDYLQLVLEIHITDSDFDNKDLDNMAKTVLDAFKGILFKDDSQIVSLCILKIDSEHSGFIMGIRRAGKKPILPSYPRILSFEKHNENKNIWADNVNVNDSIIIQMNN